jgi:hypothetical protein
MGMSNLTAILAAFAIAWLPASCSKMWNSKAATKAMAGKNSASAVSASANAKDSDDLLLTNNFETRIQLGPGKSCRIKPVLLDSRNLQLTLALEIRKAGGQLQGLIIGQFVTAPGKPVEVDIEKTDIAFTPVIVE